MYFTNKFQFLIYIIILKGYYKEIYAKIYIC